MLARIDTLLTRMLVLVATAVLSALLLVYLIAEAQRNAQRNESRGAFDVAAIALAELKARDWPEEAGKAELRKLKLAKYTVSDVPETEISDGPFADIIRQHLSLSADVPVGLSPLMRPPNRGPDKPPPPAVKSASGGSKNGPAPFPDANKPKLRDFPKREQVASVSVPIGAGRWANVTTQPIAFGNKGPGILPLVIFMALMLGIGGWSAVAAITPLRQMGHAADILAADYKHHPLQEQGPRDVRSALKAFNNMGRRLEATVEGQRQLLAAIGHDLRTPITSLKLKTEMLGDADERERIQRAISELEHITDAALTAASAGQSQEPIQRLDLYSLVDSLVEDLSDLGLDVVFEDTDLRPIVQGHPGELTRAFRNVIENGVQYGERVSVYLSTDHEKAVVRISDDGPGIPDEAMERVFEPLVRLEQSRNKETGGHGLGLHIAKSLIEAHGGTIALTNKPDGGLEARVALPASGSGSLR